ncbi:hypothetical protein BDZ91DRAFT_739485 [Kalaharituber pfeilii]|nr:hypothetical protein BDZ91DRAFT_739485 [Kalaharituber pfeilii]
MQTNERQRAFPISQKLRLLKNIPTELIPLAVVLACGVGAGIYSIGRKLIVDKQLRLSRQGPPSKEHH